MRVLDHLLNIVRAAADFYPEVQVAPACILWPDRDRQWEAVIPVLQTELTELMVLGDYTPETRTGPAIWLRCVLTGHVEEISIPQNRIPIFYLPGISRQNLRAVENCPDYLKPIAELQYRSVIWSQNNAKDWTILAYLKSNQGGLGLDVAQDTNTKNLMRLALYRLLEEEVSSLEGKRLDKDYFNTLLAGGDLIRDLLQWLDQGDGFRASRGESEWQSFVAVCKSQLAFNPEDDGVLVGSTKLANHAGPWNSVWERFCEAPNRYSNIPIQIRKCQPPLFDLIANEQDVGGWPQWNDEKENSLYYDLIALTKEPAHEARINIEELERLHSCRRSLIWAELGNSPLACALEHLASVAGKTKHNLTAGSVDDLVANYLSYGWQVDDGVIRALAQVKSSSNFEAVMTAIRSVYLPWVEESARYLQTLVDCTSYPGGNYLTSKVTHFNTGDCILFIDGLRFDVGKRLVASLDASGFEVAEQPTWSALPSVTATCKAAVTPVRDRIRGDEGTIDFEPSVADTGQSLKGGYHLKKLLNDAGWSILEHPSDGDGQGLAWCEFGDLDHEGHDRGWKLAKHIDALILEINERIEELLGAGWKRVRVVTDHGWLLVPGGLPKSDLHGDFTETKWGRCASLKPSATTSERLYPWYWNPNKYFALADGVSCFKSGEEYAHGGLSLQECLTLHLTVTPDKSPRVVESTDAV